MNANHYVLHIDPQARYDWERCRLEHPLTGAVCDPGEAIAAALGDRPGRYLVAVRWEVEILECQPAAALPARAAPTPLKSVPQLPARLAS